MTLRSLSQDHVVLALIIICDIWSLGEVCFISGWLLANKNNDEAPCPYISLETRQFRALLLTIIMPRIAYTVESVSLELLPLLELRMLSLLTFPGRVKTSPVLYALFIAWIRKDCYIVRLFTSRPYQLSSSSTETEYFHSHGTHEETVVWNM